MSKFYYVVSRIGTGTDDDPFRPDVPEGTSWVGAGDAGDGTYIIATAAPIDGLTPLSTIEVEQECDTRGLESGDVQEVWAVSDEAPGT